MNAKTPDFQFDDVRVSPSAFKVWKAGRELVLEPKTFKVLLYLIENRERLVEKGELLDAVWKDAYVTENAMTREIAKLRKALGDDPKEARYIQTVHTRGYRFIAEVVEVRPILDSGVGIAEVKTEERISGNETGKTENQITNYDGQKTDGKNRIQNRKWVAAFAVLSVFALGAAGFYLWRGNENSIDVPIKTIAVLPFKPLVLENRNEALEFGLADTLISKLSGGGEIVVRPLSAIRRYTSIEQDSLTAGRELGVESILDGTIQTWGDRIRISAKLLRTSDGKQLWAGQFDEKFTDIFALQDAISERVAAALRIRLVGKEKKHSTENVEAYQLYMKGRYHIAKLTPSDLRTSILYFQQAIDIDPGYALAYTGLAQAYGVLAIVGEIPPGEASPKSKAAGQKAIELDDTLGEAHLALCMGTFSYDWDWQSAEKECLRAIEIDPNNSDIHGNYALVLSNTGRHAEALAEAKRSRELNPLNLTQSALEGQYLLHAGRIDEALVRLQKTSELEPNFWMPHLFAASAYIEKGMFAEAIAEARKEYELTGRNDIPFGTYALAKSGKRAEARAVLEELLKLSAAKYVPPYNIALIYNALDERDHALEWLAKAYEQRDPKMTFLKVEPKWNNLRSEPRFIDLMKRMKLE